MTTPAPLTQLWSDFIDAVHDKDAIRGLKLRQAIEDAIQAEARATAEVDRITIEQLAQRYDEANGLLIECRAALLDYMHSPHRYGDLKDGHRSGFCQRCADQYTAGNLALLAAPPTEPPPLTPAAQAREPWCRNSCGTLGWTIKEYGRVTHKHLCQRRVEFFCQTHRDECPELPAEARTTAEAENDQWWISRYVAAHRSGPAGFKASQEMTERANRIGLAAPPTEPVP